MADEPGTTVYAQIVDLPGLGPTKACWLSEAGISTVDDIKRAPLDELAHVRGIGYVLSVRLKSLLSPEGPPVDDSEGSWRDRVADIQISIHMAIDHLLGDPDRYALRKRTVKQLRKVRGTIRLMRVDQPPDEESSRRKILKHVRALCALVESATELDLSSRNFQSALRQRIAVRRKKLAKWV